MPKITYGLRITIKSAVLIAILEASSKVLKFEISSDFKFFKTNCCATINPAIKPTGLKACAKFKRCVAVSLSPKERINGFEVVSKKANPQVIIHKETKKKLKLKFLLRYNI